MVPRVNWLWTHDAPNFDITLRLTQFCDFAISHLAYLFRLDVKIFADRLVLVLRIIDELETFSVCSTHHFIQKATSRGYICILFSILKPDYKLVIVFIEVNLVGLFFDLL